MDKTVEGVTVSTNHVLYDIWEVENDPFGKPWRAQMVNYVAHFATQLQAYVYVTAVKKEREKARPS